MSKFTNAEMDNMIRHLRPLLAHKGKVGYAAARNTRMLNNAIVEYIERRNALIRKYGDSVKDENGKVQPPTGISVNSPNFDKFYEELEPFAIIEHEVDIMKIKYDEAMDVLTGEEMLNVEWMLEE